MAYVPDPTLSKRENVMRHLVDRFLSIRPGVNGFGTQWHVVSRAPLKAPRPEQGNAIGIYETKERKSASNAEIGFQRCHLRLVVELFYHVKEGDDVASCLNNVLLDVQRCMLLDTSCGGLALDLSEAINELEVSGTTATHAQVVIAYDLEYRHRVNDPRR